MTPQHHYIETQQLKFHLPDSMDVNEFMATVSAHYQERILPALSNLFDRMTSPDETIQLNKIEIDIGEVPLAAWEDQMIEAIAKGVQYSIDKIKNESRFKTSNIGKGAFDELPGTITDTRMSSAEAFIRRFVFFLQHGYSQFSSFESAGRDEIVDEDQDFVISGINDTLESKILRILQRNPALGEQIRSAMRGSLQPIHRLVKQFTEAFCERLLECIVEKEIDTLRRKIALEEILNAFESAFTPTGKRAPVFSKRALQFACCLDLAKPQILPYVNDYVTGFSFSAKQYFSGAARILHAYVTRSDLTTNESHVVGHFASEISSLKRFLETAARASSTAGLIQDSDLGRDLRTPFVHHHETKPEADDTLATIADVPNKEPDVVFTDNAGIVILGPFLPAFFDALHLLDERKRFLDQQAAIRAVHLLHYLATGTEKPREYRLAFSKIICNLPIDLPIARDIDLTEEEKKESIDLLNSVVSHWNVLKKTSPDGLRETFLMRSGKLELSADTINVTVEVKSIDLLMGYLPWSISFIRLPWLNRLITIEWCY